MNELSNRLQEAVDFIKRNGLARTDKEIAGALAIPASTLSMALSGMRTPTWELLLAVCDRYPIDFEWLRTGVGSMIKGGTVIALLKRIEDLEKIVADLSKDK